MIESVFVSVWMLLLFGAIWFGAKLGWWLAAYWDRRSELPRAKPLAPDEYRRAVVSMEYSKAFIERLRDDLIFKSADRGEYD